LRQKGALAIYIDVGLTFVGAEEDIGLFFILNGNENGKFISYEENAGGGVGGNPGTWLGIGIGAVFYGGEKLYDYAIKPGLLYLSQKDAELNHLLNSGQWYPGYYNFSQ